MQGAKDGANYLMNNIYILAPRGKVTGGVELLHQLGHSLNRDETRAWMLYHPFGSAGAVPEAYQRYKVSPVAREDLKPNSIVVIPEIYTNLAASFSSSNIYYWWLSVDNFLVHARITPLGRLMGAKMAANLQLLPKIRQTAGTHLYQSEYARLFLESANLAPSLRLSDYIANEFTQSAPSPGAAKRENMLVYNPTKGLERTRSVIKELIALNRFNEKLQIVALEGLSREEICRLLGRAKVYMDFGGHPGKDRIPREAAAMGACVLVNRRGSAANRIDIPISDDYKVDDRARGYQKLAAEKILDMMHNFESNQRMFDDYRLTIAAERDDFEAEVLSIFTRNS